MDNHSTRLHGQYSAFVVAYERVNRRSAAGGTFERHLQQLLEALPRFPAAVRPIASGRRIAVLGSIVASKLDPKHIDVLETRNMEA